MMKWDNGEEKCDVILCNFIQIGFMLRLKLLFWKVKNYKVLYVIKVKVNFLYC